MKSRRLFYTSRIAEVFLEQQTSKMKVEDLALSLGVTKKTLYNYFDSKKEMVESVVDYISKRKLNEIRQGLTEINNPINALVYVGKSIFSISQTYNAIVELPMDYLSSPIVQSIFKERREEILEIVTFHFCKGVHLGLFDSDIDIELTSNFYIFQLENLFIRKNSLSNHQQLVQLLYYYLKGNCTSKGLEVLRESFDLRVTAC
ncbi:TetR/AcrR family transcriptional regulator [uncultured Acetobacteroides sp.]|uniref:TetR/AcrR family transcriptional regulator n=1 Tax=uncultured Acetobacteroides sp. TaxID=1760811 RepID=UPI0029F527ED|nr:TetR/AcrR family transcriptional regulator [uncultured Acetobacteroides sp.]